MVVVALLQPGHAGVVIIVDNADDGKVPRLSHRGEDVLIERRLLIQYRVAPADVPSRRSPICILRPSDSTARTVRAISELFWGMRPSSISYFFQRKTVRVPLVELDVGVAVLRRAGGRAASRRSQPRRRGR